MALPAKTFLIPAPERGLRDPDTVPPLPPPDALDAVSQRLLGQGLGRRALILASPDAAAYALAEGIATRLSCPVQASPPLYRYGRWPAGLKSLDDLLDHELAGRQPKGLVAVTHTEMVLGALGLEWADAELVPQFDVVPYEPGTWEDPFVRTERRVRQQLEVKAGLADQPNHVSASR